MKAPSGDDCVFVAFDVIGAQKGRLYQRVAYSVYKAVAVVGRRLSTALSDR